MLVANIQVLRFRKTFINGSSANIKLSKTQLDKIKQSGGFLDRHLGPLQKNELLLTRNLLKPLAKRNFDTIRTNSSISNRFSHS